MSDFALYFVTALLAEAGWPRKQGFRDKGGSYDTFIVDRALAQSVDWGAALGAGRPRLSLQMITEMFRDHDWDSDDGPNVKGVVTSLQDSDIWSAAASPQDAAQPMQLAKHFGKSMKPEQLVDARLRPALEQPLLEALLWGLANPGRFEAWYDSTLPDHASKMEMYRSAGLDEAELPPLPELLANSEQIVHDYERDIGPLPSIPPRLLDDAIALGWKVSD